MLQRATHHTAAPMAALCRRMQLALLLCGLLVLSGCVSNKEMTYMQGIDALLQQGRNIQKDYGLRVQKDDQLAIIVSSQDRELIQPFNNATLINSGTPMNSVQGTSANLQSGMSYFYVDQKGEINFPVIGTIKAGGRTIEEISADIQARLRDGYIKDATVTTHIMSFKVTVLGDVKAPGVQSYTGQRLTLLEALGRAGDLNSSAVRKNILVLREEGGKRTSYRVDLTNPYSVFQSPAYYLQQNDLIYVESNKSVKVKGSTSYTYLTVSGTLVSMAASVISLIIALSK